MIRNMVSIVIPVYNGADYLRCAIDSALAQTYANCEVIVVNDGSNDDGKTEDIARSYGDRIRYIRKENGGVATALNMGIENMRGEYFSWLSHDDMYTPDKVENEMQHALCSDDTTTIIAEGYQVVNASGEYQYTVNLHKRYSATQLRNGIFVLLRGGINGCGMLIHKSHFQRVGCFDPSLPTTQDYDLFFRMLRGQQIVYLDSSNVLSRSHEKQGSKAHLQAHILECEQLWIKLMNELTDTEKIQIDGSVYGFYANTYDYLRTASGYTKAIRYAYMMMLRACAVENARHPEGLDLTKLAHLCNLDESVLRRLLSVYADVPKDKARIALFGMSCDPIGGLDRMQMELMLYLCKNYEFSYIFLNNDKPTPPRYADVFRACYIPEPDFSLASLAAALLILGIDILIMSYNCNPQFLRSYSSLQKYGIKTIAWNHEDYFLPLWRESLHDCLLERIPALNAADASIWINAKSYYIYSSQNNNGAYLPNFVAMQPQENGLAESADRKQQILAIGRFDDMSKGLEPLLRTFANVLEKSCTAQLKVVGSYCLGDTLPSNPNMTYEQLINMFALADNIEFLPWQKDVADLYRESRVHVLLSTYEGFGLTVVEAAAWGTPTVAYDGSGMADIINDGVNGFLVPIDDLAGAAEKIRMLLEDDALWLKLSHNAFDLAKSYAPEKIIPRWEELIDNLMHLDKESFREFLSKEYATTYDLYSLLRITAKEYEDCIRHLIPRVLDTDPAFTTVLSGSYFWRLTRPIRALRFARKQCTGIRNRMQCFCKYMRDPSLDVRFDAGILNSKYWRIIAPLCMITRPIRRNNVA